MGIAVKFNSTLVALKMEISLDLFSMQHLSQISLLAITITSTNATGRVDHTCTHIKLCLHRVPVPPDHILLFTYLHQLSGNPSLLLTLPHETINQYLTSTRLLQDSIHLCTLWKLQNKHASVNSMAIIQLCGVHLLLVLGGSSSDQSIPFSSFSLVPIHYINTTHYYTSWSPFWPCSHPVLFGV